MRGLSLALLIVVVATPALAEDQPKTNHFQRDGSWQGQVTAQKWGGINTDRAWAVGQRGRADAIEACQVQDRSGEGCIEEELLDAPLVEIFANCQEGIAWQKAYPERYTLAGVVSEKVPESHRARETVASWFEFLCPRVWAQ